VITIRLTPEMIFEWAALEQTLFQGTGNSRGALTAVAHLLLPRGEF
jgi:hypothetical protein